MIRDEIIEGVKEYFEIEDLVGIRTAGKYGQIASWRFLDTNALHALLIVRVNIDKAILVNRIIRGKFRDQRGLRTNIQPLVKKKTDRNKLYISPHIQGKAFDFDVIGMTPKQVRTWVVDNEDLFPFKIRLEDGVNWTHLDVIDEAKNPHVYLFFP